MISQAELEQYDKQGLIPGPEESEADFLSRASVCLKAKLTLEGNVAFVGIFDQDKDLSEGWKKSRLLYNIAPTWAPLSFSNQSLMPWQAAVTWLEYTEGYQLPLIQLRSAFLHKEIYLGLYKRHEIVAHEAAHIGRMAFDERKFEEFFAYQSSSSPLQRLMGPLVEDPREIYFFLVTILLSLCTTLSEFWFAVPSLFMRSLQLSPLLPIAIAMLRLGYRHLQWNRCRRALAPLVIEGRLNWTLYRLTDREIATFGIMEGEAIRSYATEHAAQELRWRLLLSFYFRN